MCGAEDEATKHYRRPSESKRQVPQAGRPTRNHSEGSAPTLPNVHYARLRVLGHFTRPRWDPDLLVTSQRGVAAGKD